MRRASRDPIVLRVKLLDQQALVRLHVRHIIPLMRFIGFDLPRLRARFRSEVVAILGFSQVLGKIRVQRDQVILSRRSSVTDGEVIASYFVQGSPEVDDPPACLLELLDIWLITINIFQLAVSD